MQYIGRYAPSPSGRMHTGNAFTAICAWAFARQAEGTFVLRIEDLDRERCRSEYAEILRDDLKWIGIDWDTETEPQSRRTCAYDAAMERLTAMELIYPCYCNRSDLHAAGAPHASDGTFVYAGTCRYLTPEERAAKQKVPAFRIMVPNRAVSFEDRLQGYYGEKLAAECGDFIVRRSDGGYAYQLAVVVDDAASGVTEVVRGLDLLPSSARQLWLYETLGYEKPGFAHVPLLCAEDGRRLSKRERDLNLNYIRLHYTPQEFLGKLFFAAGVLKREEPVSLRELLSLLTDDMLKRAKIVIPTGFFMK